MKNFETLISLLIVGISSLTNAQVQVPTEDELLPNPAHSPPAQAPTTTAQDIKIWLKEKCDRNGGAGAFESAMKAPRDMKQCMKSVVDIEELQMELEMAKRQDNVTAVSKKYCRKVPEVEKCLMNMKDMLAPCFDPKEREDLKISDKITAAVLEYICENDGERITGLMAAGGLRCIQSMRMSVMICAYHNLGQFTSFDLSSHPLMNLGPEKCSNLEKFKTCTTRSLERSRETCPGLKPADLFEGLFASVRKVTLCEELLNHTSIVPPTDAGATQKPTGINATES